MVDGIVTDTRAEGYCLVVFIRNISLLIIVRPLAKDIWLKDPHIANAREPILYKLRCYK